MEILAGVAGSGKTTRLIGEYREALRAAQAGGLLAVPLWLAPGGPARGAVLERLCDGSLPVLFSPNVLTFAGFAKQVLRAASQAVTPLTPAMQRLLLRRIVGCLAATDRLPCFGGIAHTAGFLDVVEAFIAELKRNETWPERLTGACAERGERPADRDLALIYDEYQRTLLHNHVYDAEGEFWSARQALQAGDWGPFDRLSLVVVDGFTDFTPTQYEILSLLARKADRTVISLTLERQAGRNDLFAKPLAVLQRLLRSESATLVWVGEEGTPRPEIPAAIAQVAMRLFSNPRTVTRVANASEIELVAAAGQQGEVNWLAARIKRLLLDGTPPEAIVVAVRDLPQYREVIDQSFRAAGIPFALGTGPTLDRAPVCRALVKLLQCAAEDWPFRDLTALVRSSFFRPDWPELDEGRAAGDVSQSLRFLQLAGGRRQILDRLEHAAARSALSNPSDRSRREERIHPQSLGRAYLLLKKLSQATASLRREHTLPEWAEVIAGLWREFGFGAAVPADQGPLSLNERPSGPREQDVFTQMLFDASRAARLTDAADEKLPLSEFLPLLTDLLQQAETPPESAAGRVRVLSAEQVRNLDVPCLFLAGLTERSFPRRQSDDCLYTEADRRELNRLGLSLADRAQRAQEELLMFYGIVTRARRRLFLSYPCVTPGGEPLSPSPYVGAIQELFAPGGLEPLLEERLDPVPSGDRVLSPAEARVRGMFEALTEGRAGLLRAVCEQGDQAATMRNVLCAADMQVLRFHTRGFTPFEGRLAGNASLAAMGQQFSPEHEFSATQLERYAACPFRFFVQDVLRVEPLETPDVETEHGRRGTLVHAVLADLHRELAGAAAGEAAPSATVVELFQRLLREKLSDGFAASDLHRALQAIEERLLLDWGTAYGRQWEEYVAEYASGPDAPRPAHLEVPFGASGDIAGGASSPPLIVGRGEQAVRIGGRIDRLDVTPGEAGAFTVIDYKTGRRRKDGLEQVQSGLRLQLALYALAAARLKIAGRNATPRQMGYWHVAADGYAPSPLTGGGKKGSAANIDPEAWNELVETLETIVPRLAASMRGGWFPVFSSDKDCTSFCPYQMACRVNQIRPLEESLGKTWSAAGPSGTDQGS